MKHTREDAGRFDIVASNLPGSADPGVPLAAARAGFTGLLNLEHVPDLETARLALAALDVEVPGTLGVKLDAAREAGPTPLVPALPTAVRFVAIAGAQPEGLARLIPLARSGGRRVLVECRSASEALAARELGADGCIAKGQEAGGRAGEETAFILLQWLAREIDLPIWVHGGVGLRSAAACHAGGAAGVVLDGQLGLARESSLPSHVKRALERMQGDETALLGIDVGAPLRVYAPPGNPAVAELRDLEAQAIDLGAAEARDRWTEAAFERIGWSRDPSRVWPLGQDAAWAAPLARRFRSVAGILAGMQEAIRGHGEAARRSRPFDRGSRLARAHGTAYPIVQGPMTRVSDNAAFAAAVADAGALPFLALAMFRAAQVRQLLEQTRDALGDRPWGVGILGFVPPDLRQEQLAVVEEFAPRFALIAGGRVDQVLHLEERGIATYLHAPSPGLLRSFLENGVRRFVFEGSECGGHVGPRTSFVLWDSMIEVVEEAVEGGIPPDDLHVLFAGGIHDARSSAMTAAMAAPLAERGVRLGVSMGSGYLFTVEAVETGAIVPGFQETALACSRTILVESGPGHSIRCADTPFYREFQSEKRRLRRERVEPEALRDELERVNLGRLRLASKGILREPGGEGEPPRYVTVGEERQRADGMYMIGQLAALRRGTCRMADLHREVCEGGSDFLGALRPAASVVEAADPRATARPCDIAIVGMGCLLPKASGVREFWANLLAKVDAISEIPKGRFDSDLYFDGDRKARDKIYSRWGGFLDDRPFDPIRYGIPPNTLGSIDPFQLLTLEVVHEALEDAGYPGGRGLPKERTSVILGASGGLGDVGLQYAVRSSLPALLGSRADGALDALPEWTEDSFPGILLNVAAGRVANRFDFGGVNFTVDAACASSLSAVYLAARELENRTSDLVLAGGIDTVQSPFAFLCFSKTQALSRDGRCRTFDERADGTSISEGLVVVALKRLADAERDGDRIYAVIKAVAGSSDGRDKSLAAPRPAGQMSALARAYALAGFSPASVGLVEAHGTGTVAGDAAELASLSEVFQREGAEPRRCALGSVKSSIGHTKAAAGAAGLMKVALALHHKVLPPTLHVEKPIEGLRREDTPFFPVVEAMPWIREDADSPRRAGVSAFGFGGTNFHAVLEEYAPDDPSALPREGGIESWPAELFAWSDTSAERIGRSLDRLEAALARCDGIPLRDLAATVCGAAHASPRGPVRLALVASYLEDLRAKIAMAREALARGEADDPRGVYLGRHDGPAPPVAFVYPGQGSQYPHMAGALALHFPEVRRAVEEADRVLSGELPRRLSRYVFPPPAFVSGGGEDPVAALTDTAVAQPALGAVEIGITRLLRRLGVDPAMAAGHSYGEYVALWVAGAVDGKTLLEVSAARGRLIRESLGEEPGEMRAVPAGRAEVAAALEGVEGVWLANFNGPRQTILAGRREGLEAAERVLAARRLRAVRVPVACAFHSPLVEGARRKLAGYLAGVSFSAPSLPVFSNSLAAPYPRTPEAIRTLLSEHLVRPVEFVRQIEAMAEAGARVFLEVGPKRVLTSLVSQILGDRSDAIAVAIDGPEPARALETLLHGLARLSIRGVPVAVSELFEGRARESGSVEELVASAGGDGERKMRWWINGACVRREPPAEARETIMASEERPDPRPEKDTVAPPAERALASPGEQPSGGNGKPLSLARGQDGDPSAGEPVVEARPAAIAASSDADAVILRFQDLMSQFLQTQRDVMRAYLEAPGSERAATEAWTPSRPAEAPARRAELGAPTPRPTARPGPPAIARPDPPGEPPRAGRAEAPPESPGPEAARLAPAAPASAAGAVDLPRRFLELVSDRTGYPMDMLDLDLKIEGDLSIDSIKRVEILAAFERERGPALQEKIRALMDRLTGAKTLRDITGMLGGLAGDGGGEPRAAAREGDGGPRSEGEGALDLPRLVPETVDAPLDREGTQKKNSRAGSS